MKNQNVYIVLAVLGVLCLLYYITKPVHEHFESYAGWLLQDPQQVHYENAHGSAPAGVNAIDGESQYEQNSASPPVNAMYKRGNPQNVYPEFKEQP
jgi:hypothetical protein